MRRSRIFTDKQRPPSTSQELRGIDGQSPDVFPLPHLFHHLLHLLKSLQQPVDGRDIGSGAFSIRVNTSPMPRMREAIRSGWKTSKSVSFSPTPTNWIGQCVTERRDSAAPPRASPSSLVKMAPDSAMVCWKALVTLRACW